jgi:hypothetical protein
MATGSTGSWASQYKDPRWQKKRLEIMERDNFTCRSCGAKDKTLNVHHAYYDKGKRPWEYPSENMITWCEKCHKKTHDTMKSMQLNLLELSADSLEFLDMLIATFGSDAVIGILNDSYLGKSQLASFNIRDKINKAMSKYEEAFIVLFHVMEPDLILKALIDANADYDFADAGRIADAIMMLAKCYHDGFGDGIENREDSDK